MTTHLHPEFTQAFRIYHSVFMMLNHQVKEISVLDLKHVSPELLECENLELAVPGTYNPSSSIGSASAGVDFKNQKKTDKIISIRGFDPKVTVISSKQRPRKLKIYGSDGEIYQFLLKGHEDIRQDQRVMQLFDLINDILLSSEDQHIHDLSICRYSTIPLAPNNGLIGWVPHCDTLHALIKEYRDANMMPINCENQIIQSLCPDYDSRALMVKVEVFEQTLQRSNSDDLAQILWQKSSTAENWSNFTRSLAVMSMVGYILGLGDRHPSNIMINRASGKVVHIDFGDCFEVAIEREKVPETIPFRLTRMLIGAMEVTGMDGTFRITCETVIKILRMNYDSLLAVLEAFVYDPVINWRLFVQKRNDFDAAEPSPQMMNVLSDVAHVIPQMQVNLDRSLSMSMKNLRKRFSIEQIDCDDVDDPEQFNGKSVSIVDRVKDKLRGRDFCCCSSPDCRGSLSITESCINPTWLDPAEQVDKLIKHATASENLCQVYIGWCPFW